MTMRTYYPDRHEAREPEAVDGPDMVGDLLEQHAECRITDAQFCGHTLNLEPDHAEQFLKFLDKAGIASVVAGAWEYQDGKNAWHSKGCCIELDVRLNAKPAGGVR